MPRRLPLLLLIAIAPLAPSAAEDAAPKAREWRSYCQGYLKAAEGDASASDLDVTYCVGITQGLLNGMRVGSQLGALSMGSLIAVKYNLDPDAIYRLFESQPPQKLMGICAPAAYATRDYVKVVLDYLAKKPGDVERPIAEVFFDALDAAHPCS